SLFLFPETPFPFTFFFSSFVRPPFFFSSLPSPDPFPFNSSFSSFPKPRFHYIFLFLLPEIPFPCTSSFSRFPTPVSLTFSFSPFPTSVPNTRFSFLIVLPFSDPHFPL